MAPSIIAGPTNVAGIVEVRELNNHASCSPVYVLIPSYGERYLLNFNPIATSVQGFSVQNSAWHYFGILNEYHIWIYIGNGTLANPDTYPAGLTSRIGFTGLYNNQGTSGVTTFTVQVFQGSGGETNIDNNFDGETITYFK